MEAARVQEMSPKPLVRRTEGGRELSAAVSWLRGGNLERGGIWNEEVEPAGVFPGQSRVSSPWISGPNPGISFTLAVAEPAEHPGIDLGMVSCRPGVVKSWLRNHSWEGSGPVERTVPGPNTQ